MQSWKKVYGSPEEIKSPSELKLGKPNDSRETVTII